MDPRNKPIRFFNHKVMNQCWNNAQIIEGRDPQRWRYDVAGNPVVKCLRGCMGPLCYDYSQKDPNSTEGRFSIDNCQISKYTTKKNINNNEMTVEEPIQNTVTGYLSSREMDLIEIMAYGNISTKNS